MAHKLPQRILYICFFLAVISGGQPVSLTKTLLRPRASNATNLLNSTVASYLCHSSDYDPVSTPPILDCMSAITVLPPDSLESRWFGGDFPFQVVRGECHLDITADDRGSDDTSFLELRLAALQLANACTRTGVVSAGAGAEGYKLTPGRTSGKVTGLGKGGHITLELSLGDDLHLTGGGATGGGRLAAVEERY